MDKPETAVLDQVYSIGFLDGLAGKEDTQTLKLIHSLSLLPQFNDEDGYDVVIEYYDGFKEGIYNKNLNLLWDQKYV